MPSLDDIIKGCKNYEKAYQHILYEKYALQTRSLCYRYLYNSSDLDDVVHDSFIKVFVKINQYSGIGSFEGWLKKIFINTAFQYNRKHKRSRKNVNIDAIHKKFDDDDLENTIEEKTDDYAEFDKNDVPENYLEAVKMADFSEEELLHAINEIPEKLRTVFNLYCIEEFSHDEIAEILQIDVVTSRTRLLRGRQYLKKYLYELCLTQNRI
jgi:RNA polymerase sigma-70 factor, ECF subfamily